MKTFILILFAWFLADVLILVWWSRLKAIDREMDREMDRMIEDMQNASAHKI